MVKRQTQRPTGRRRQTPAASFPSPKAPASGDGAVQEELASAVSPAAVTAALDGPPPQGVAAEPFLMDTAAGEDALTDDGDRAAPIPEAFPPVIAAILSHDAVSLGAPADGPLVFANPTPKRNSPMAADIVGAGATLQAFLLNEGLAAIAHWRAMASVTSPAEALRLQVDEIQRAAEASLTCMGRIAGHFGRMAAA